MLKKTSLVAAISATLLLSGCAVPGGHISGLSRHELQSDDILSENASIKEITPSLLSEIAHPDQIASLNPQLDSQVAAYDYRVGIGDVLNITVWDHPELTIPAGSFRDATSAGNWVHADGSIFYPYVGKISVAGKPTTEIRDILQRRLAKYIEDPQVDVTVAAFRSQRVYITGEVNQPGVQPITNIPLTLLDAVNQAGGIGDRADWRNVTLSHGDKEEVVNLYTLYQKGDLAQNRLLRHNDVIHVPRNDYLKVFVMGEVGEPKTQIIDRNAMTLAEALSNAGGIKEASSNASGIFVVRNEPKADKPYHVYQLNAKDSTAMVLASQFELKPYDVVYVTAAPLNRWNRVIAQLLPTITGLNELSEGTLRIRNW